VDDALREAEDSIRLNPRGVRLLGAPVSLRAGLETLEHAAITVRIFARALADSIRLAEGNNPLQDPEVRDRLAGALAELAVAIRISRTGSAQRAARIRPGGQAGRLAAPG
jgi:hypothetical protein